MATGILSVIVMSVTSAVTAGQQHAYEAQQRIAAALAAEDLLARISMLPYDSLPLWHNYTEAVGGMDDAEGNPMPATFDSLGRDVRVTTALTNLAGLGVKVRARTIRVRCFDRSGRFLATANAYVTEPQS